MPLDFRIKTHAEALSLREKGWTRRKIAGELGVSRATAYKWILGSCYPTGSCNRPDLSSSPSLSYLVGDLLGVGNAIRSASYHYEIRLRVRDHDFAEPVFTSLSRIIQKRKKVRAKKDGFYVVRAWSRLF